MLTKILEMVSVFQSHAFMEIPFMTIMIIFVPYKRREREGGERERCINFYTNVVRVPPNLIPVGSNNPRYGKYLATFR